MSITNFGWSCGGGGSTSSGSFSVAILRRIVGDTSRFRTLLERGGGCVLYVDFSVMSNKNAQKFGQFHRIFSILSNFLDR